MDLHLIFLREKQVNGIIYISSFACGIDSVVVELIKDKIDEFPFMILKIDEHTGEAGLDTRVEAFADMLKGVARMKITAPHLGKCIFS